MPAPSVLWVGKVDSVDARIVGIGDQDCYVEELSSGGEWQAVDDEQASRVYITAFLEVRGALHDLYDRDMGNQSLKAGVESLENASRVLGISK